MADGLKIQLQGLDAFNTRLDQATLVLKDKVSDEITAAAFNTAAEAKQRAPVNYGILKNSIVAIEAPRGNLSSSVEVHARYAAYVEFGTGTHVDIPSDPEGVPEYALQFKGTHSVPGMYARPYLFPAFRRQREILFTKLKALLETI